MKNHSLFTLIILFLNILSLAGQKLDSSFASQGIFQPYMGSGNSQANTCLLQADGKLIIGGSGYNINVNLYLNYDNWEEMWMIRILPDGRLDSTFGENGHVIFEAGGIREYIDFICQDSSGRLIVGFTSDNQPALLRTDANGKIDSGFGLNGLSSDTLWKNATVFFRSMIMTPEEGFFLAGPQNYGISLKKLTANGHLDTSFHPIESWQFPAGQKTAVYGMAIQHDSLLLVAGYNESSGFIHRLGPDGAADSSFGNQSISNAAQWGARFIDFIHVFPNQHFLAIGRSDTAVWGARFTPNGNLDTLWGIQGFMEPSTGQALSQLREIHFLEDGRIRICAWGGSGNMLAFGYQADGQRDPDFGYQGLVRFRIENKVSFSFDMAVQDDSLIYLAGSTHTLAAISRLLPDGRLDPGFADLGYSFFPTNHGGSELYRVKIDAKNQIWASGLSGISSHISHGFSKGLLIHVDSFGQLLQQQYIPEQAFPDHTGIYDFVEDSDSSFIVTGQKNRKELLLERVFKSGKIDLSFSQQVQKSLNQLPSISRSAGTRLTGSVGNKFLLAGAGLIEGENHFFIIRLEADGRLDSTFNQSGVFFLPTQSTFIKYPWGLFVNQQEEILLSGSPGSLFMVAKIQADGNLATNFGLNGIAQVNMPGFYSGDAYSMEVYNDGKILLGGNSNRQFGLVLLNANGVVDTSFGNQGAVRSTFQTNLAKSFDMIRLSNKRILMAGSMIDPQSESTDIAFACFTSDGLPCPDFGTNGQFCLDLGGQEDIIYSLKQISENEILLVGKSNHQLLMANILTDFRILSPLDEQENRISEWLFYPNPVNGKANISYQLNASQQVIFRLLDLHGKEVALLLKGQRTAGNHLEEILFPPTITEGAYLLNISTSESNLSIRILVKN